jgi:hypothetical protein
MSRLLNPCVHEAARMIGSRIKRGSDRLGVVLLLASAGGGAGIVGALEALQPDGVLRRVAKKLDGIVPASAAPQLDFLLILIGGGVFLLTWGLDGVCEWFRSAQRKE